MTRGPGRPGDSGLTRASRSASYEAAFRERYLLYQYHSVEFLCAHLADCARVFRGDLQQMLVLAVIGQVQLRSYLDVAPDGSLHPREIPAKPAISASRLADVTGIPRETVRRKLTLLERRGWIEKTDEGAWRLVIREGAAAARTDLNGLDGRAIERFAALAASLERIGSPG